MENLLIAAVILSALLYVCYRTYKAYKGKGCACSSKCSSCSFADKDGKCH